MIGVGRLTFVKYDAIRTSAVSLSGKGLGRRTLSGKSMMLSSMRCLLGSSIKGEPISDPAVFSTTMRISCRIDSVDASPM